MEILAVLQIVGDSTKCNTKCKKRVQSVGAQKQSVGAQKQSVGAQKQSERAQKQSERAQKQSERAQKQGKKITPPLSDSALGSLGLPFRTSVSDSCLLD